MFENNKEDLIPKVEFTFQETTEDEEQLQKEIDELMRKKMEILESMRNSTSNSLETNQNDTDYPRKSR